MASLTTIRIAPIRLCVKPSGRGGTTLLIRHFSKTVTPYHPTPKADTRLVSQPPPNMSGFSNTDVPGKTADPYVEKNKEVAVSLKDKVEDLVAFMEKHKFCMLTTRTKEGILASRCMSLAAKEGNGIDAIFHTNTESGKTDDIAADDSINVAFLTPTGEWASISGHAEVITDRSQVKKYYSPTLKAWLGDLEDGKHDGGPEDPRIGLIKVSATTAQYAISNRTIIGSVVELAKGVATGEAPKVNKLRHLSEAELKQWRSF